MREHTLSTLTPSINLCEIIKEDTIIGNLTIDGVFINFIKMWKKICGIFLRNAPNYPQMTPCYDNIPS